MKQFSCCMIVFTLLGNSSAHQHPEPGTLKITVGRDCINRSWNAQIEGDDHCTKVSYCDRHIELTRAKISQKDRFDVFTYETPEYFSKSELPARLQWSLNNNDTSFCVITIWKSQPAPNNLMNVLKSQWNEYVRKPLNKADKKPLQVLTGQLCDGWTSTLAIGNFYQNKKKCIALLYSFRNDKMSACAVYAFSDKMFKGPIETFSKNLHLTTKK
jgi:hypothetical protein